MGEREQLVAAIQAYMASPDADPTVVDQLQPISDALGEGGADAAPDPMADPSQQLDGPDGVTPMDDQDMAPMDMGPEQGMPGPSEARDFKSASKLGQDRLEKLNKKQRPKG